MQVSMETLALIFGPPAAAGATVSGGMSLPGAPAPGVAREEPVGVTADAGPVDLSEAVAEVQAFVQGMQRQLQFRIDEEAGSRTVVTILDSRTLEIIRQVPPEEILALARYFREYGMGAGQGHLFQTQV